MEGESKKYRNWKIAFLLGLFCAFLYFIANIARLYDDAYMFVRYAHNLVEHGVFGWEADAPAYGCTSVAYVFSQALLIKLGLLDLVNVHQFLRIQSGLYFFLFVWVLFKVGLFFFDKENMFREEMSWILVFLTFPGLIKHFTGMDTMMSLFANTLLVYAAFSYQKKQTNIQLFWLILVAYLSFSIRPDNFFYASLFPFLFLIWQKASRKHLLIFSSVLASLFVLDSYLKYLYFGDFLPIPFYVKAAGFYEAYLGIDVWNAYHFLANFILIFIPFIFLIVYAIIRKRGYALLPFLIPFLLTNLYFLSSVQIMGANSRLLIPSLPLLIGAALIALKESWSLPWEPKSTNMRGIAFAFVVFLFFALRLLGTWIYAEKKSQVLSQVPQYELEFQGEVELLERGRSDQFTIMNDLIARIDEDDFVISASEHGFISAHNLNTRILCFAGLHNLEVLKERSFSPKAIENSLRDYQADLIWLAHSDYVAVNYHILTSPAFYPEYDFYPGLLDFGIGIRKDSKYKAQIEAFFKETYALDSLSPARYEIPQKD